MTPYLQQRALYPPLIGKRPSINLGIVVVIPAYREEYLLLTLMSLKKCALPDCDVEVIVVVNDSERDSDATRELNLGIYRQAMEWSRKHLEPRFKFYILYQDYLPARHAGVGLARKIGMDEAVYRFEKIRNPKGVIVCFDADSRCAKNYLQAIEAHFRLFDKSPACAIHFEHPLSGYEHEPKVYAAIAEYELHLRYYTHIQRFTGFPFATDTIGSSMAVRANAYQQQGGMNKRKAGEDFYFLHKFSSLKYFTQLHDTCVYPSPRLSDRVPFGTGRAIQEILKSKESYSTYAPQSFVDLKCFFDDVNTLLEKEQSLDVRLASWPESVSSFLQMINWTKHIREIQQHTKSPAQFRKRFFRWFNAFQIMKFAHHCRDQFYPNVPVAEAAHWLLKRQHGLDLEKDVNSLLWKYRALEKSMQLNTL
ncbi:MAG: glycosyltransferase family 2 protein [Bacteroidota bacterium]